MNDRLGDFLGAAKANKILEEKLESAASLDAVVEIAREAGYMITLEEMQGAFPALSDQDLENLAGGWDKITALHAYLSSTSLGCPCKQ